MLNSCILNLNLNIKNIFYNQENINLFLNRLLYGLRNRNILE